MRPLNNSNVPGQFMAKAAPLGSEEYATKVAKPVMGAVDEMPKEYRELVQDLGYVDVYRAWRKGWSAQQIRGAVVDGRFVLG